MSKYLKEFRVSEKLSRYVDAFWVSRNTSGEAINWPVVPDGCSDIIFYLNNSKKLEGINDTFVTGIMEQAQLIPIIRRMEFFGIRFKPGILFCLFKSDMSKLTNGMVELRQLDKSIYKKLSIDTLAEKDEIIATVTPLLEKIIEECTREDRFLQAVTDLTDNPNMTIDELAASCNWSTKNLEQIFIKRMGLTPKKFTRIMRLQKAYKKFIKKDWRI